ncbi:YfdX family protein [Chroogloeocystis siderophila]|uniref:YfdX family protein n=1 Tax=Chroogloeocystis siderophila 5.2 s.c.1 TaxID=247279 RepID=A0A1U7HUF0_9CHRO|nr:YfdX family protein [Chroogloeocystis siderophila]MCI3279711.1 YfdX family protein [Synechococcus sp. PCC 6717]OKH27154.1 hypothetical protein NIES1031_10645 [Chroogloeocystis siderophila 5.2 s.c.1]
MTLANIIQSDVQAHQEIEKERQEATTEAEKRVDQEAIAAIAETRNAITAIDEGKTPDAIQALERATGKLDILLARYPNLSLIPISSQVTVLDLAPLDFDIIAEIRAAAKVATDVDDFPNARALLHNLTSEIRTTTVNLPLETYPDAMKEAARLLERGQIDEARTELKLALSTLVVTEQSRPIPLIVGLANLVAASALAKNKSQNMTEQDQDKILKLLKESRTQLNRAKELGYVSSNTDYKELQRMIKDIERQVRAKDSTEGPFAKLREQFSSFLKRRSEKVSKSVQEGQQATNSQAN